MCAQSLADCKSGVSLQSIFALEILLGIPSDMASRSSKISWTVQSKPRRSWAWEKTRHGFLQRTVLTWRQPPSRCLLAAQESCAYRAHLAAFTSIGLSSVTSWQVLWQ